MTKLFFVVSDTRFLISHRRALVVDAFRSFASVVLVSPNYLETELRSLENDGLRFVKFPFWKEAPSIRDAIKSISLAFAVASKEKNSTFLLITVFSIVIFGLPLRLFNRKTVYTLSGFGTVFTTRTAKNTIVRHLLTSLYVYLFNGKNSRAIVQNLDDFDYLIRAGVRSEKLNLILGSGIDSKEFSFSSYEARSKEPTILVPARLIREKGIIDAVEASDALIKRGVRHVMLFAGDFYPGNPTSLTKQEIENIASRSPQIRFLGKVSNLRELYKDAWVVLFPSYREGLPKAVLEAFSVGRPVVAYDVVGVRQVVSNERNGFLCRFQSKEDLSLRLEDLLKDQSLAKKFGYQGSIDCNSYRVEDINEAILSVLRTMG